MDLKETLYQDIVTEIKSDSPNLPKAITPILATLLSHRTELSKLMAFLIDTYISYTWDRSLDTNKQIARLFHDIALMPKRHLYKNTAFRDAFCNLAALTLLPKPHFVDKERCQIDDSLTLDLTRVHRKLENVLLCREAFGESTIVSKHLRTRMTAETAHLFDALNHHLKTSDKKTSLFLTIYILNQKEITYDRVPNNTSLFDDIREDAKADIGWYVWWFLLLYTKRMATSSSTTHRSTHWSYVSQLTHSYFNIYKSGFMKKNRNTRLKLIYNAVTIIMRESTIDQPPTTNLPHLELFEALPEKPTKTNSVATTSSSQHQHQQQPHPKPVMTYLDCVIYSEE